MEKFKDHVKNYKKKYVALYFDKESNDRLRDYARTNYFDISYGYDGSSIEEEAFEFHTTVFYKSNEINLKNGNHEITPIEASFKQLKLLGPDHDIPVIELNGEFKTVRESFEIMGLKDKWPNWIPHVTLSYKYNNINNKPLPNFKVRATHIIVRDQS